MSDSQGNPETPISKWSGIRSQMFSERHPEDFLKHLDGYNCTGIVERRGTSENKMFSEKHPEDFLKHLDGYNIPSIPSLGPRSRLWIPRLFHFIFTPTRMLSESDEEQSDDNKPSTSAPKKDSEDDEAETSDSSKKEPSSPVDSYEGGGVRSFSHEKRESLKSSDPGLKAPESLSSLVSDKDSGSSSGSESGSESNSKAPKRYKYTKADRQRLKDLRKKNPKPFKHKTPDVYAFNPEGNETPVRRHHKRLRRSSKRKDKKKSTKKSKKDKDSDDSDAEQHQDSSGSSSSRESTSGATQPITTQPSSSSESSTSRESPSGSGSTPSDAANKKCCHQ